MHPNILITHHHIQPSWGELDEKFKLLYFTNAYRLEFHAVFSGWSTETEANVATIAFLIDNVIDEKVPVIFHLEMTNKKMENTVSQLTCTEVLLLYA